ncbi:leucine-rich repeat flightless-interacting protein 1 isoform X18 [Eleutherodactylus coqui]|uniref:leucine-rich repeat flightless-interacting protein 1 isoform X18 n=1 Tax=Eleutherodactylus coqui TaxID=57060 RepID=UPI0034622A29
MGTQGPGRKRHPNREKLSAEDYALNQIAREAEARLAAKRAARAEAREIRMKELERQQKEVEERPDKDFAEKSGRPVSSLSAATLASLGGTSSRRGSGDTSISIDTEASMREIKEISELKEQIEDVEGKYMQGLKEMKDSLAEVEEKYKRSMVTNAQLDNEKTSLQYQVDTVREILLELEEELAESRRQYEDKQKECERQKHEQGVLRFQLAEMKEALEQREALMTKHGIVLDSNGTMNGDASVEHHVNSDGPPDPPVRAVSMGKTEGTVEEKETMSGVGQCPSPKTEQDRQETAHDDRKEIPLHAEGGDETSEPNEKETSNTIVEMGDVREDKQEMSQTEVLENVSEVDGETTFNQNDVSPSGSEIFQDAIDFTDESPSAGSLSDCEKEEPKSCRDEILTTADDTCNMGGFPKEGPETPSDHPLAICSNDDKVLEGEQERDKASSSHEDIGTELPEKPTSDKNVDLEHEVPVEEEIKPQQSQLEESGSQAIESQDKNDGILSTAGDNDQSKIVSAPEQSSHDTVLTSNELVAQVEGDGDKISDVSESSIAPKRSSITKDEPIKECRIPEEVSSQNEHKPVPEEEGPGAISLESEDLKAADQREGDLLSHVTVCESVQNADDTMTNEVESPKEIAAPDVFSSEGESTQEGEETDDDDDDDDHGTMRSEKYTGESEMPHAPLGSSVDRQSLEDIRMEESGDKSPKKGKGKNKEDCVAS